jgi:acetyl-CoA carboxylase alpha subunit
MLELETAERVFPEPEDGLEPVWQEIHTALVDAFAAAKEMPMEELLERRYQRFRKFGQRTH